MKLGILARIEAKPEYADQIAAMLRDAAELAAKERYAVTWYSFRQDATTFGVFDTFDDEHNRQAHLEGQIAAALASATETMLASAPVFTPIDLLGVKAD
jgi:quinol monooxygenase YgiN